MSRWFRVDDGLVDDPKVQQLPDRLFRAIVNLWCVTSQNDGNFPPIDQIAFKLRMTSTKAAKVVDELRIVGLVDDDETGSHPHNWNGRQFKSDVSTDRVKQFRERRRNVSPTVSETPPETEQKQNRAERTADAAPRGAPDVVDEDPKAKLFRIGKTILVSFGIAEKRTGSLIGQWLKTRNDPEGLLGAIEFARDQNVAEPVAYISTLLTKAKPNGNHGKQDLSAMCTELAGELRAREHPRGFEGSDELFGSGGGRR